MNLYNSLKEIGGLPFWLGVCAIARSKRKKVLVISLLAGLTIDSIAKDIIKFSLDRPDLQNLINKYHSYISILFFGITILVAFTRIFIGSHYPLDTIVAIINGLIVGFIIRKFSATFEDYLSRLPRLFQ